MPDALSRRPDYHPGKGATSHAEANFRQALASVGVENEPKDEMDLSDFNALQPDMEVGEAYYVEDKELREGLEADEELESIREEMMGVICTKGCGHPLCEKEAEVSPSTEWLRRNRRDFRIAYPSWNERGLLMFDNRIVIPDVGNLRLKILRARHNSKIGGHGGVMKTLEIITRDYFWTGISADVEEYVKGCAVCQRTKASRHSPYGKLKNLVVPERPWQHITMDFIEQLPASNGFDAILVVVDRLSKFSYFIPTKGTDDTAKFAELFLNQVVKHHGLPETIVSDRGNKFTARFWRCLMERMGVDVRLSTAYHPQTDGQTERTNQAIEHYLRVFVGDQQDDWATLLDTASLAYNNSWHSAIKMSPFFANYGYHPRLFGETRQGKAQDVPAAVKIAENIRDVHRECATRMEEANKAMAQQYNKRHSEPPAFQVGDKVRLEMTNIATTRPTKKMDLKYCGPFEIIEQVGSHAFRLKLPETWRKHNVFHVSKLEPWIEATYPGQATEPAPPIEVEGHTEYEVKRIVDSIWRKRGRQRWVEYKVEWVGYEGTIEATSWENSDALGNARQALAEFHRDYPSKPREKDK
jgi:hypothetical protein